MKTEHFALLTKVSRVLDKISNIILGIHFGLGFLLYSYSGKAGKLHLSYESDLLFVLFLILGPIQGVFLFGLSLVTLKAWAFLLYFLLAVFFGINAMLKVRLKMHSLEINPSKNEDSNY